MQLVEHGRQAAAQRQQLRAGAVEADAHGTLQGHAAAVAQQRAERTESESELESEMHVLMADRE